MGAIECRSTRLYAYSERRCERAIGAIEPEAGSLADWLRGWSSSRRLRPCSKCRAGWR
jgi:hypothetical protein